MTKETMIILGVLAAIIAIVFFLIVPTFDSLGQIKAAVAEQNSKLTEIKDFDNKIDDLKGKYDTEEMDKLALMLPKDAHIDELLMQLDIMAAGSSLTMKGAGFTEIKKVNIKPTAAAETDNITLNTNQNVASGVIPSDSGQSSDDQIQTLQVNVKLAGTYDDIKNYLASVEKNIRLMDMASFDLTSTPGETASPTFDMNANFNTYYQP